PQRAEMALPGLEDLPIERPRLLGASRPADLGSAGEERRGLGVVLARRGRAVSVEEPLEVEADRDEGAERGEQRHGKDGCAGWRRSPLPSSKKNSRLYAVFAWSPRSLIESSSWSLPYSAVRPTSSASWRCFSSKRFLKYASRSFRIGTSLATPVVRT